MTMTDQTEPPAEKPKRKGRRRQPSPALAPKPAKQLAGLTVINCCAACNSERCVISGRGYCAHPRKGGLQGSDMHDPETIGRMNAARKMLGKKAVDMRYA